MKIYFIRHSDTFATEKGLIQGSANGEQNFLSPAGKKKLREKTIPEIERIMRRNRGKEIMVYSGDQQRHYETLIPILHMLSSEYRYVSDVRHLVLDDRLNGRNYGKLEGEQEAELSRKKNIFLRPAKAWSYIFAQAGLDNMSKIEKRSEYEQKVFDMIYEIFVSHKKNQVVFVVSDSDFFKAMQKCKDIARLCYFGDEEIDISPKANGLRSTMKIETGEVKPIIIEKPAYVESRGKMMSTPEKYATKKLIESGNFGNIKA